MQPFVILGLTLGSLVVFQPALNRLILEHRGLGFAVWFNGAILLTLASISCVLISLMPQKFPEILRFRSHTPFEWWFMVPGLFGFSLVMGVPLMIKNLGAFSTIMLMLCGQLATSFAWDTIALNQPCSLSRLTGLVLAATGAYLSFR